MDKPMIGIRQADGSFYEILGDVQAGHKRLILSAARVEQRGVRIELYRSTDGSIDPSGALGEITLDDPQGLGYQDIEFRLDLDADGQMEASAALPGQPPQTLSVDLTPFRGASAATFLDEFPPLDLGGGEPDSEPMTLDLPDLELPGEEVPPRSDNEILADEAFAEADLDSLDDFGLDAPPPETEPLDDLTFEDPEGGTPETRGLENFDLDEPLDLEAPQDLGAAPSFDLGDLDAGFGEVAAPPSDDLGEAEEWEKVSLDDIEPMEFLDTGAEISKPSSTTAPDSFRMDDEEPLELGDLDSDLSDLPDFGDPQPVRKERPASDFDTDFDQDFLPPPSLTEPSPWEAEPEPEPVPLAAKAPASTPSGKTPKTPKAAPAERRASSGADGLDRMSLILSLAALSLLVLLILVLLFLNMIKAPQAPVIQPEVQRWNSSSALVATPPNPEAETIDLGAEPVSFVAQTVLEVPEALKTARISLVLEAGETVADATRRFGAPARAQGDQLSW